MKTLTIKNFKSIDENGVEVNIAPITLIFGKNNTGKSNILKSISVIRRILKGQELTKDEFTSLVHKHEISRVIEFIIDDKLHIKISKDGSNFEVHEDIKDMLLHSEHVGHPRIPVFYGPKYQDDLSKIFGERFNPIDPGRGVRSFLQVIDTMYHHNLVTIENPEFCLHPAMEVEVGEFFLRHIRRNPKAILLVETNSEHIMLRILRRIRETNQNSLPENSVNATKDDVSPHWAQYIKWKGERTELWHLGVTEDGDFDRHWPEGFFDERVNEIFP